MPSVDPKTRRWAADLMQLTASGAGEPGSDPALPPDKLTCRLSPITDYAGNGGGALPTA